jgi:hypothetical protein
MLDELLADRAPPRADVTVVRQRHGEPAVRVARLTLALDDPDDFAVEAHVGRHGIVGVEARERDGQKGRAQQQNMSPSCRVHPGW